ncbi:MAG TPA: PH domain-containing protein [Acidimicrobiales bacterium]|nr:PH domain-containing protein [Acidimicrobiales bacterium]
MAFPRKLLNDDEDIALDLHPHWWFLFPQICLLAGAIVIGIAALLFASETSWIIALAGLLVLVALANFGIRYAQWSTTNFVVTTDRLIYRHGVVAKHGIEIPLERVNTVFFSQSMFERMLRSGDLVIESAGEMGRQNFSNVRRPSAVQNEIYRQMESNENRKFDRLGVQARSAAPEDSIPSQIRELEQLRREGVVSDEEFRAKKQQLLDRM